jgi:hypothetical protein
LSILKQVQVDGRVDKCLRHDMGTLLNVGRIQDLDDWRRWHGTAGRHLIL